MRFQIILHRICYLLSLPASAQVFRWLYRRSPGAQLAYWLYMIWGVTCVARLVFGYYCMTQNLIHIPKQFEPWGHKLTILTGDNYVLISLSFYLIHCINCFDYNCRKAFKNFGKFPEDMFNIIHRFATSGFSAPDRICNGYLIERDPRKLEIVTESLSLKSNRYANSRDKSRILIQVQILEITFISSMALLVGAKLLLLPVISYLFIYSSGLTSGYTNFRYVFDTLTALLLHTFVGVWAPLVLMHGSRYGVQAVMFTFKRIIRNFPQPTDEDRLLVLISRMKTGRRVFVYILGEYIYFNDYGLQRIFTCSMISTLIGSLIISLQILIGNFDIEMKLWMGVVVIATILVLFVMNQFFCSTSDRLYHGRKLFSMVELPVFRKCLTIRDFVGLNFFLEVANPKRKFRFTFSVLGKITYSSLISFVPCYTSLIFFILPLIQHR